MYLDGMETSAISCTVGWGGVLGRGSNHPIGEVESVAWLSSGSREGQKLREVWDRLEGVGSTLAYDKC